MTFKQGVVYVGLSAWLVLSLGGCAAPGGAHYRPIVDTKGVDLNRYEADLRECQSYATQTAGAAESAATGAAAGALFGAVVAAAGGRLNQLNRQRVQKLHLFRRYFLDSDSLREYYLLLQSVHYPMHHHQILQSQVCQENLLLHHRHHLRKLLMSQ